MATDISKAGSKGGDKSYDTSQIRGVREERGIVTGYVKANVHPTHMGVLSVWIPTFSTDESDKTQWRSVRYCTPYYSRVDSIGAKDTYFGAKAPSGIITPPPDLGTKVLCFFPEGRNAEGYYFACVPDLYMMQTLPEPSLSNGVASGEFNDSPSGPHHTGKITNWKTQSRPQDYFTQSILVEQGLDQDRTRGINNSTYMRESPSELIGITSKGRRVTLAGQDFTQQYSQQIKDKNTTDKKILKGLLGPDARRRGHSITLDDGDVDGNSNQVRLRTSTGHQILLNDTEGVIYVGNADGTAWIELGLAGTMDVYAQDSINFRSRNINFHTDENIKFHSKGFTQFVSEKQMHVEGKEQLVMTSEGEGGITAKGLHLNSTADLYSTSQGNSFISASSNMSVAGALVLLQGPKTPAKVAKNVSVLQKEDTTYDIDQGRFILDEEQQTSTTVDRITMHEPFPYHTLANQTSPYTGGLTGGGGGPGGAFSVIGNVAGGVPIPGVSAITSSIGGGNLLSQVSQVTGGLGPGGGGGDIFSQVTGGSFSQTFNQIAPQLSNITSNLPIGELSQQIGAAASTFSGADFGNIIQDASGKITGLASELGAAAPGLAQSLQGAVPALQQGLTQAVPQLQDTLGSITSIPVLKEFPVTDLVKQVDTGFSIGALDTIDMQGLNAAVVKQVGSLNNPAFIDGVTKSVGKYGFNVDQLKTAGLVRPDAVFNDQLADASVWTGKSGANSLNKFLSNSGLQEEVQQLVVANDYQKLANIGGITATDGKKEVMSMLTASNISSADVAAKVRQGRQDFEGIIRNTTNIPTGADAASTVKDAMVTGAAASNKVEEIKKSPSVTTTTMSSTNVPGGVDAIARGDTNRITQSSSTETVTETVTGGGSTTRNATVTGGEVRTAKPYDPYAGANGGKLKQIDEAIASIESTRFNLDMDGQLTPDLRRTLKEQLLNLYAQRNELAGG
jgi:hypothetical protein